MARQSALGPSSTQLIFRVTQYFKFFRLENKIFISISVPKKNVIPFPFSPRNFISVEFGFHFPQKSLVSISYKCPRCAFLLVFLQCLPLWWQIGKRNLKVHGASCVVLVINDNSYGLMVLLSCLWRIVP
jgi:hypothetical protein